MLRMEYSVNTRPLLQESDSEVEDTGGNSPMEDNADSHVVVTSDVKPILKLREPSDRFHLAYTVFYLLGMTTLLPWNFFITAEDYWMFKLRDTNANYTLGGKTKLQTEFTAYLSMASTIPNTLFLILSSFIAHKLPLQFRMNGSLIIIIVLFVITAVLVKVDTDSWQTGFFALTLCTVVIVNAASAILQGSLFGVLGKFAPRFITAAVAGQALGGIFAALAEIFSLSLNVLPTTSGFIYFIVAIVMLTLSIIGYCLLSETGYNRDGLLLPVILGTVVILVPATIAVCFLIIRRRRRQKDLRRETIGKIASDLQYGDKATLLADASEEE